MRVAARLRARLRLLKQALMKPYECFISDDHPGFRVSENHHRARTAGLIRTALGLLTSKWAVDVLLALGAGPRRYHELLGELAPISEKVLTHTVRAMERDGLISRVVQTEVPPRVEYALTPLGASLARPLRALGEWSLAHEDQVEAARRRYDARRAAAERPLTVA
jgi:DNA-binding HxlR family transcriptional regulator